MVEPAPQTLRFKAYEANLANGELRRHGTKVPLQDKPFQMLALLLRRPGELVTREELRSELWPADTFVDFEHGLNTAVKKLRQSLDDSAETPRFVETLPRRGYRFVAPVSMERTTGTAEAAEAARASRDHPSDEGRRSAWHPHAPGALVMLAAVALVVIRGDRSNPGPPPNPRPVVVLMDSPLPGRVYDRATFAAGGSNADDITDALQDLKISVRKETTNAAWHREEQVVRQNPDLIIAHLSCLLDARVAEPEGGHGPVWEHMFAVAESRLLLVFGYVGAMNPRTRFLVYSRGRFDDPAAAAAFVSEAEARLPALRGRLRTLHVPGGDNHATFRDPATAQLIRERVQAILKLE